MIDSESVEISVVVHVYNEEENRPIFIPNLLEVLKGLHKTHEVIFVDDGSSDRSGKVLKEMALHYSPIRVLKFQPHRRADCTLVCYLSKRSGLHRGLRSRKFHLFEKPLFHI